VSTERVARLEQEAGSQKYLVILDPSPFWSSRLSSTLAGQAMTVKRLDRIIAALIHAPSHHFMPLAHE
jgi:hypothetical protein